MFECACEEVEVGADVICDSHGAADAVSPIMVRVEGLNLLAIDDGLEVVKLLMDRSPAVVMLGREGSV